MPKLTITVEFPSEHDRQEVCEEIAGALEDLNERGGNVSWEWDDLTKDQREEWE